jgi:hypothetical protein
MLVNTKQKVAVLASGLAIASTGLVTDAAANPPNNAAAAGGERTAQVAAVPTDRAKELAARLGLPEQVVRQALQDVFGS